ncbi:MAG: TIGR01777 family protein [Psychroserpens sp.]|nr:TIGR01777 family protein [Psychroserpens sp.]
MKTITIAGGSGFLGQVLENHFEKKSYSVYILTRFPKTKNHIYWDAQNLGDWTSILERTDVLINLTGKSVDCRYNSINKQLIYDSRIDSTHALGLAINLCETPPDVWINASTATIYRHSLDKEMSEENGDIGNDFSMNIAKSWEATFNSIYTQKTRKIALRTAIVMGKKGGALNPLKYITRFGLGGKQGHGLQKVSWIHELDFARAVEFLILNSDLEGSFNITVPKPTTNTRLMRSLRKILNIPFGIPQPESIVKLGAKLIGTEAELVLKSRNVIPTRLLKNGFRFKFTNIEIALSDLLAK